MYLLEFNLCSGIWINFLGQPIRRLHQHWQNERKLLIQQTELRYVNGQLYPFWTEIRFEHHARALREAVLRDDVCRQSRVRMIENYRLFRLPEPLKSTVKR